MISERRRSQIVIYLFMIGSIFISISIYISFSLIPNLDKEISKEETKIQDILRFEERMEMYQVNEKILINQIAILSQLNYNLSYIRYMENIMLTFKRFKLHNILRTQTYANETEIETLDKKFEHMNYEQLSNEEYNSAILPAYGVKIDEALDKLNKSKNDLTLLTTIFQIIGLLLNQLAIILQFRWFELESKKSRKKA